MTDDIGNDGLTNAERASYATAYREGAGKPSTEAERKAIREWLERKAAQRD